MLISSTHSLPVPTLGSYQSPFSFSTSSRLIYLIVTHTCTGFDTAQDTCRGPRTTSVIAWHLVRDSVSCLLFAHIGQLVCNGESPPFTSSPDINSRRTTGLLLCLAWHRSTTDMYFYAWLGIGPRDLNLGPHTTRASTLPMEPSPRPPILL